MSPETDATATEAETEAPATDEVREAQLAELREELGDAVVGHHIEPGVGLWARIDAAAWDAAAAAARGALGCEWFDFLSGIDWLPSPYGRYEDTGFEPVPEPGETTTGVAGGDTRFQVFARVVNVDTHLDLILKVDVPDDTMTVPTWVRTYSGANWHERETHEMFGITFAGHPNLINIYLPTGFEGNPLRKDFPLLTRRMKPWPGIVDVEPMPGAGDEAEGGEEA